MKDDLFMSSIINPERGHMITFLLNNFARITIKPFSIKLKPELVKISTAETFFRNNITKKLISRLNAKKALMNNDGGGNVRIVESIKIKFSCNFKGLDKRVLHANNCPPKDPSLV